MCNFFHIFKEVRLLIILKVCYNKLFIMFKIYELIAEHGHKVLHLPHHCHFDPIELIWSQAKIYWLKLVWNESCK
jgi:hypothetical protein